MIIHTTYVLRGLQKIPVTIKAEWRASGLSFRIAGLPDSASRELRVRITAALASLDVRPEGVSLTFEGLDKAEPALDLPAALCALAALGSVPAESLDGRLFFGELSLRGQLRPIRGVLPLLDGNAARSVVVPLDNATEAGYACNNAVAIATIEGVISYVSQGFAPPVCEPGRPLRPASIDYPDVPPQVLRALETAAASGHSLLLVGPPGSGKTMLARLVRDLLPPPSPEETRATSSVYSVAGLIDPSIGYVPERPFRAPHHTVSETGLVGDGRRPGEVSLAHGGVLFLDETAEFRRAALDALRDPHNAIVRQMCFPGKPLLIGATSPCPCGYFHHPRRTCRCSERDMKRYMARIPEMFDLRIAIPPLSIPGTPLSRETFEASRARVQRARESLPADWMPTESPTLRALRIARTIAALDGAEKIRDEHVLDARALVGATP